MTRRVRAVLLLIAAVGLGFVLVRGVAALPAFGRSQHAYASLLNRVEVAQRHATSVVSAVVFDYRAVDTMGEEFILYAAVVGVALLLRPSREEVERIPGKRREERTRRTASETVRALGVAVIGLSVVHGIYVVVHGHLSPGGGFQGGTVLAAAAVTVALIGGFVPFRAIAPEPVIDASEGVAATAYPVVGALALISGAAFLTNMLPFGTPGDLLSGGTVPVLNVCVGLEVSAAFVLILSEFLEQTLAIRRESPR